MHRHLLHVILLALLAGWIVQPVTQAQAPARRDVAKATPARPGLGEFDAFAARVMKDWKVPGMAIAVVRDGQVILSRGYGSRNQARGLPVTPATLFAIGSATKSFTAAGLAALVKQGRITWDTPVREYLPELRLADQSITERLTPRDLVTHRSGLPRHDAAWYNADFTRADLVRRLRYFEPSKDLRERFQYNNLMFLTAGYLTERTSGRSWEETIRALVLEPLGMTRSNFSVADSQKADDFALPYEKDDSDVVRETAFRNIDVIGPAGSINSSVEDMIRYVMMHLDQGRYRERDVLAAADVLEMQTPQMVVPGALVFPELSHQSYGLGLFVTTYRGRKLVHHGGAIDGFSALVSFMPQERIGLVVLTNLDGSALPTIVSYNVYDRLLGLDPVDWSARYLERQKQAKASEETAKAKSYTPRREGTRPAHPLDEYLGDYEHPGYGQAAIGRDGDDLTITFHGFTSRLKHFHYEVFEVPLNRLDRLERTKVMFHTSWNGDVSGFSAPLEPAVADILFTKIGDRSMRSRAFLEPLAGQYQLGPTTVTFALRADDTLTLSIPGQPTYELVPVRGSRFDVKGLNGYAVEFKRDAGGAATEVVFYQPGGTFVATRK